jgi:hypothetical protein
MRSRDHSLMTPSSVLFFLLATTACFGQFTAISYGEVQDIGPGALGYLRPRIALNADAQSVVLWGRTGPAANYLSVAVNGSFNTPVMLTPPGIAPAVADWMGSSIASDENNVWMVFKATPEETAPCYARMSDDGGLTWSDTIRVSSPDSLVSRFPSVSVIPGVGPVIEYMEFTSGYMEPRQVVVRMENGVFQPPVQVSVPYAPGEVCDCCTGEIVAGAEHVVAMYRNAGSNFRTIWAASSLDGGTTFPVGAEIDPTAWLLNACPSSGPDGYLSGDSLRYVFLSGADNGNKVFVGSAGAMDLSVGSVRNVHPEQAMNVQQNFPRVAGSGDTLGIVWQQTVGSQTEVLFSWSVNGISGLRAPDTVNVVLTGAQKTPDVAFADGAFHIVWSDPAAGVVRYRKAMITDATGVVDASTQKSLPWAWYDASTGAVHFRPQARIGSWRMTDAMGRVVRTGRSSGAGSASGLSTGSYQLSGIDGNGSTLPVVRLFIAR